MEAIINELDAAMAETVQLLESADATTLNKKPTANSWSPAQISRHLYKAGNGTDKLMLAAAPKADRQPDERADSYKAMLLDFDTKMDSPEFIIPEDKVFDKDKLVQSLTVLREALISAAKQSDLHTIPDLPEGNPLGGSTKLELLHFITYHTQRHNHKIKDLLK